MSLKAAGRPFIGFLILSISYLSHDEDNDDDDEDNDDDDKDNDDDDEDNDDDDAEKDEDDNLTLLIGIGWNEFGWGEFAAT